MKDRKLARMAGCCFVVPWCFFKTVKHKDQSNTSPLEKQKDDQQRVSQHQKCNTPSDFFSKMVIHVMFQFVEESDCCICGIPHKNTAQWMLQL